MGRSAKPKDKPTVHEAKPNDLATKAKPYLDQIERIDAEMEEAKAAYMAACKGKREEIRDTIEAAADAGVNKRALKGIVKARKLARKIEAIDADFDMDDAAQFNTLAAAFGEDTPFGRHAKERAEAIRGGTAGAAEILRQHREGNGAAPQQARPDEAQLSQMAGWQAPPSDSAVVDELAQQH